MSMDQTPPMHSEAQHAGHETRDVSFRPVLIGLIGIVTLVIAALLIVRPLMGFFVRREARTSPPANPLAETFGRQLPPAPRLQPDPLADLHALHAQEDAVLTTYGWVDRQAGIVRIPVSRAMELVIERGLPARPEGGP